MTGIPLLEEEGWREAPGWSGVERPLDRGEHAFQVLSHVFVLESHYTDPELAQKIRTPIVVRLSRFRIVRRAIQLDRQLLRGTIEVQYVRPNTMLTPELAAAQLPLLQMRPEEGFFGREVRAEFTPLLLLCRKIVEAHEV